MTDFTDILNIPNIQRIFAIIRDSFGLETGLIPLDGDIILPGNAHAQSRCTRCPARKSCWRNWFDTMTTDDISLFHTCRQNISAIMVPVYLDRQCEAAVCASGFVYDDELDAPDLEQNSASAPVRLTHREGRILLALLSEAASQIQEHAERHKRRKSDAYSCDFSEIVGSSQPMRILLNQLEFICHTDSPVCIHGAPGTGKQLIAHTIHQNSLRKTGPFLFADCSAMTEMQLESELFGHVCGAFSEALTDQPGLFDVADHGTFMLGEIHALTPKLQFKLLKLLEYGSFMPLGGTSSHSVNVRIIASSSQKLDDLVVQGGFRQDLFYRLSIMSLDVPTLADRLDDIPEFAAHFLEKICLRNHLAPKHLAPSAIEILQSHTWPGNLSEFANEMERLVILSAGSDEISSDIISPRILQNYAQNQAVTPFSDSPQMAALHLLPGQNLQDATNEFERRMIESTLAQNDGNRTKAAEILGISRRNLIRKIESLGIDI